MSKCGKLDGIFENFLATGNVPASADLGLMQESGKEMWVGALLASSWRFLVLSLFSHSLLMSHFRLGLSIVAENINRMRYMSHFRAVHRGASFMTSRSSDVRQLKPDAWGFLCPVHTPDGSPCGLLNHLSSTCEVREGRANQRDP